MVGPSKGIYWRKTPRYIKAQCRVHTSSPQQTYELPPGHERKGHTAHGKHQTRTTPVFWRHGPLIHVGLNRSLTAAIHAGRCLLRLDDCSRRNNHNDREDCAGRKHHSGLLRTPETHLRSRQHFNIQNGFLAMPEALRRPEQRRKKDFTFASSWPQTT